MRFKNNDIRLWQHLINELCKWIKRENNKYLSLTEHKDLLLQHQSLIWDKMLEIEDEELMKILFN